MRPQPVLNRAAIAAAVTVAVTLFNLFGIDLPGEFSEQATDAILGVISVVSIVVAGFSARSRVTPLSDPQATVAVPLVAAEAPHDVDEAE